MVACLNGEQSCVTDFQYEPCNQHFSDGMASSKILGVDAVKIAELGIIVANEGSTSLNGKLTTERGGHCDFLIRDPYLLQALTL